MEKIISNNELAVWTLISGIFISFIFWYLEMSAILVLTPLVITNMLLLAFLQLNEKVWGKHLPMDSSYNFYGYIEIHVNENCHKNRFLFIEVCLETILIGIDESKDILFDTWLIPEEKIKRIFKDAAEFRDIGLIQKSINFISKIHYKSNNNIPAYRCVIHVDKLTEEQKKMLQEKLNAIKKRRIYR